MTDLPHSTDDEAIAAEAVDMGTLLTENKALQHENKSLHDRLLRALAEAENVRRQADRTITEARQYAVTELARELLTVVDNLQRTVEAAQKHSRASAESSALLEGVQATLRAFLQTLERFGVRPIDARGKSFDPNFHEAVMQVDDSSSPPGTVTQVLQQGYTIHNRLLRPARVAVSKEPAKTPAKRPEEMPSEPEDNDLGSQWRARPIEP
jgi:molecular chaperone GrpE